MKRNNLGIYLENYRIKNKITLSKMAIDLGISSSYLCQLECGIRKPNEDFKISLIKLYGFKGKEKQLVLNLVENSEISCTTLPIFGENRGLAMKK